MSETFSKVYLQALVAGFGLTTNFIIATIV
ncbi:uncharacterized protein METZ01_LOCUS312643, partial [marine metagenome]